MVENIILIKKINELLKRRIRRDNRIHAHGISVQPSGITINPFTIIIIIINEIMEMKMVGFIVMHYRIHHIDTSYYRDHRKK